MYQISLKGENGPQQTGENNEQDAVRPECENTYTGRYNPIGECEGICGGPRTQNLTRKSNKPGCPDEFKIGDCSQKECENQCKMPVFLTEQTDYGTIHSIFQTIAGISSMLKTQFTVSDSKIQFTKIMFFITPPLVAVKYFQLLVGKN